MEGFTMYNKRDEKGNRYGRLVVIKESPERSGGHVCWRCKCDCGNSVTVDGNSLRRGGTVSCGCYRGESRKERRLPKPAGRKAAVKKSVAKPAGKKAAAKKSVGRPERKKAVAKKSGSTRVYRRK
jgi:hypothetical protein